MSSDYGRIMGLRDNGKRVKDNLPALHTLYETYAKNGGVIPGKIVRWKSGLRPQWGMEYEQPAIVLQAPDGQREVCIGYIESDNAPSISWVDPNRLESFE